MYNCDLWPLHADQITRDQWKRTLWPSFRHLTLQLSHPRSGLQCVHSLPAHPIITLHLQSVVLCCAVLSPFACEVQCFLFTFPIKVIMTLFFWVYIQKYLTFLYCLFIIVVLFLPPFCVHWTEVIPGILVTRVSVESPSHTPKAWYFDIRLVWNFSQPNTLKEHAVLSGLWDLQVHFSSPCMVIILTSFSLRTCQHIAGIWTRLWTRNAGSFRKTRCYYEALLSTKFSPCPFCPPGEDRGADCSGAGLVWIRESLASPQRWLLPGWDKITWLFLLHI